jgi:hypothetical protein
MRLASFSLRLPLSRTAAVLPSFIDNAWTGASYVQTTTSFARSTDGDRLLTAIFDQQICLMLHDGEKGKLDVAVGLSQSGGSDMCDYGLHNVRSRPAKSATSSPPATLARARGGLQHRNTQTWRSAFGRGRSCRFTASLSETDAPEKQ